ncbi:MAG: hypothetical protein QG650_1104 [Patescibacteria group bacterium]|nr:hypothetical protein [Patescibacteria group bacterium]
MELYEKNGYVAISSEKREILLGNGFIEIEGMKLDFPGEYEKSGVLVHVMDHPSGLLFSLRFEDRDVAYVETDELEVTEGIADFFRDVDLLVLKGTKNAVKLFENLEARLVVPYGEEKSAFLTALGQNVEPVAKYKTKELDFEGETTGFVYLG